MSKTSPPHPGRILLREHLIPRGMTQSELAIRMGVPFPRINEIVRGRRGITAESALLLEAALGHPAEAWMLLQVDWDLARAREEREEREEREGAPPARPGPRVAPPRPEARSGSLPDPGTGSEPGPPTVPGSGSEPDRSTVPEPSADAPPLSGPHPSGPHPESVSPVRAPEPAPPAAPPPARGDQLDLI